MRDNYAAEVKALTQHLATHKESMAFARLADRYLRLHEVEKAIDICHAGLRNHPYYTSAHFVLAKCYLFHNQFDEAEKHLKHILSQDPKFLNAHKLYAELMAKMGLTSRERESLIRIHTVDPMYPIGRELLHDAETLAETAEPLRFEPDSPSLEIIQDAAPAPASGSTTAAFPSRRESTLDTSVSTTPARGDLPPESFNRTEPLTESFAAAPADEVLTSASPAAGMSGYAPPVPEMNLDEFARELAALEMPEEEEKISTVASAAKLEPFAETEEIPEPENDFDREESHFSDILDDLFSLSRDEEDLREREARSSIERAASRPEPAPIIPPSPPAEVIADEEEMAHPEQAVEPMPAPSLPKEESRESPRMSPVLPFRGDEVWQDETFSEQLDDAKLPAEHEPLSDETGFAQENEPESPLDSRSADFEEDSDELSGRDLLEEEEEEQFTSFLSNLDRLGGANAAEDQEELYIPAPEKEMRMPWREEPIEPAGLEPPPSEEEEPLRQPEDISHANLEFPEEDKPNAEKPKEKFVTPTLGEIYAAQGQYAKAISVFEMLMKKNPENEWYRTKLEYLRKRLEDEN